MKHLFTLLIVFSSTQIFAQATVSENLEVILTKIEDITPQNSCATVIANVFYQGSDIPATGAKLVLLGKDDAIYTVPEDGKIEIVTDSNIFSADLNPVTEPYNPGYSTGSFSNIELSPGKRYHLTIEWAADLLMEPVKAVEPEVFKPVLYFYPEKEMDIEVQLEPYGEFTFTYPKYTDGWSAKISPNGNINVDGKNYPYLFWEGKLKGIAPEVRQSGFVVTAEETISFLEEKLALMGLNEREMTDFITFWAPQLEQNPYNFIHFVTGSDYETQIASLELSQKPDSKIRIHLWFSALESPIQVKEQLLQAKKRKGFSVVEWGGGAFDWITP